MRPLFLPLLAALFLAPPAARADDAARAKRAVEIEKQIAELEERLNRLRAELAGLKPPPKVAPAERERIDMSGTIKELLRFNGEVGGFTIPDLVVYFAKDAEFVFSDKTKAGIADLKVGQSVTVRINADALLQKRDPPLAYASKVIIHRAKNK